MLGGLIAVIAVSAVVSAVLCWLAIRLAPRLGFIDRPGTEAHKQQSRAVPYGGGAAMALAFAAGSTTALWLVPGAGGKRIAVIGLGALTLCALGMIDDRRPLGAWPKL